MESILTMMKQFIGYGEDVTQYDKEFVIHINSIFMILHQLGVGPSKCFSISDKYSVWDDFMGDCDTLEGVKTYMKMKLQLIFDPPASSVLMESMKQLISEFEWRVQYGAEEESEE